MCLNKTSTLIPNSDQNFRCISIGDPVHLYPLQFWSAKPKNDASPLSLTWTEFDNFSLFSCGSVHRFFMKLIQVEKYLMNSKTAKIAWKLVLMGDNYSRNKLKIHSLDTLCILPKCLDVKLIIRKKLRFQKIMLDVTKLQNRFLINNVIILA